MINDDRAAQIFVDDVGSGSGYAVTAQLILTARHVLHREGSPPPAVGSAVEVRLWGDLRNHDRFWRHGTVYWWDPDRDVALLRLADGEIDRSPTLKDLKENGGAAATIGELPADGDFDDCRAFGWPRVMNRGEERPPMPFRGTAIARGRRAEDPIFAIATDLTPNEETGWKGMSGAAFRINQTIVGIVIEADDRFKEDPLAALPLAPIALQSAFWQAVGVSTIRKLRGKSPRGLPPPYVQAPALYVPRPELTEPILTFLHQHHSTKKADIAVIAGMGGLGKSTVARWIASTPRMRQVFADGQVWVTLGTEHADALIMLTGWINAIRAADEPEIHLPTHEAAKAELERRLCDRAVLFVIDDIWPKNSEVAANLLSNASRCGYLITTRFADVFQSLSDATKKQVTKDRSLQVFDIESMSEEQGINLLERHLKRPLSQGERSAAHDLIAAVGGHPLSLELTAGRIDGESLTKLARDLSGEFVRLEQIEKKQRGLGRAPNLSAEEQKRKSTRISLLFSINDLNEKGRTLFATLGVLAKDSIITSPAAATLWSTDVDQAADFLRDLSGRHLLRPAPRAALTDGFRLHHLLHDLARELLAVAANPAWLTRSLTELPPQVEGQISAAIADGSQKLLERYRAKTEGGLWHTLADDNYIYDHLVEHFETAGWKEEIEKLLWEETADGRCGWYAARERLGQTEGFLADVRGIWDYADRALASATGETLALQLHCALINASINSLSAVIFAEVLVAAVRCGLMALPAALALARQNPAAPYRVSALLVLANEMPAEEQPSVLGEALAIARGIDDAGERARALAEVAQQLPAHGALAAARGIDDAGERARALAEVAQRLPAEEQPSVLGEALAAAPSIEHNWQRGPALAEVAQRLPAEEALAVARSIDDAEWLGRALAEVAQRLPAEEALAIARGIDDAGERAEALAAVAQRLPAEEQPSVLGEALAAARSIDDAWSRILALAAVAQRLPAEEQPSVLGEALAAARSMHEYSARDPGLAAVAQQLPAHGALAVARGIEDANWRARALAEVAQRLPAEEQPSVLGEALAAARAPRDADRRAWALAEVAQRLPAEEQPSVLGEALAAARGIGDAFGDAWERAGALAAVAQRLPAEEALAVARGIEHADWRARALAAVAQRLPAEEALAVARGIEDAWERARALAEVAQRLPAEEALAVARGIEDAWERARALAAVAQRLPAEEQPSVLGEALAAARATRDADRRALALVEVAQRLPAEEQPSVLGEALAAARGIDDAWERAWALVEVAQRLPAEEQPSVLGEALAAARATRATGDAEWWFLLIDIAERRGPALAAVAQRLPAEEALAVARGIEHADWRARALAAVAQRLPAEEQPSVLGEALAVARATRNADRRALALVEVAQRLPAEEQPSVLGEALAAARGIEDDWERARALAAVAQRLPAEEQPSVLGEALAVARGIEDDKVARSIGSIGRKRAQVLAKVAEVAERLVKWQILDLLLWTETVRMLAMRKRSDFVRDVAALLPLINTLGEDTAVRGLRRSIVSIGRWWP